MTPITQAPQLSIPTNHLKCYTVESVQPMDDWGDVCEGSPIWYICETHCV